MARAMRCFLGIVGCGAPLLILACSLLPQGSGGLPVAERYAEVLGEYEIDLSSLGASPIRVEVFPEGGLIYVAGNFQPDATPLNELGGLRFSTESPVDGHMEIEFLRNEEGVISACKVVAEEVGLNARGVRLGEKKRPFEENDRFPEVGSQPRGDR